jgi:hypothetical protein
VRNRETHRESTTARSRMTGASPGPGWEEGLVGGGGETNVGWPEDAEGRRWC